MPMNLQLFNAASIYGVTGHSTFSGNDATFGSPVSVQRSWGSGSLPYQAPQTFTVVTANGFKSVIGVVRTGESAASLTGLVVSNAASGDILFRASGSVATTYSDAAGLKIDNASIFAGADTITGNDFGNVLQGFGGADTLDGGNGVDTAVFSGNRAGYTVGKPSGAASATSIQGPDGSDTLVSIERLRFDDATLAYDLQGSAGKAYRLYQAAFDRKPDAAGLGYHIGSLDAGAPLDTVSAAFVGSAEFAAAYGALGNAAFVTQLYQNVLHRGPDSGGQAYWTDLLDRGALTRAGTLAGFSESTENQAAVIGAIGDGILYTPYG